MSLLLKWVFYLVKLKRKAWWHKKAAICEWARRKDAFCKFCSGFIHLGLTWAFMQYIHYVLIHLILRSFKLFASVLTVAPPFRLFVLQQGRQAELLPLRWEDSEVQLQTPTKRGQHDVRIVPPTTTTSFRVQAGEQGGGWGEVCVGVCVWGGCDGGGGVVGVGLNV